MFPLDRKPLIPFPCWHSQLSKVFPGNLLCSLAWACFRQRACIQQSWRSTTATLPIYAVSGQNNIRSATLTANGVQANQQDEAGTVWPCLLLGPPPRTITSNKQQRFDHINHTNDLSNLNLSQSKEEKCQWIKVWFLVRPILDLVITQDVNLVDDQPSVSWPTVLETRSRQHAH